MTEDRHPLPLKPRARLMQHLGEDLIPNDRVALFELVKNCYDADATTAVVKFRRNDDGVVTIEVLDDGHGMDERDVVNTWFEIATPNRLKEPHSESGRRRALGAKGLGRFAVARLARRTTLITRRPGCDEVVVEIDWDAFDDPEAYLEDLKVDWRVRPPSFFAEDGGASAQFSELKQRSNADFEVSAVPERGTRLILHPARGKWSSTDIASLVTSLGRLTPPAPPTELGVEIHPDFQIVLDADERAAPTLVGTSPTIAKPSYRLVGRVTADGDAELKYILDLPDGEPTETQIFARLDAPHGSGAFVLDIRVWDLDAEGLRDLMNAEGTKRGLREVRNQIKALSGVAVYRDGFRVQPYGDPDFDWLNMDARRVNNPTLRLSTNQVVGFVFITADGNPDIRDQANRQGLIDNVAFRSLQARIISVVKLIEERRYEHRRRVQPVERRSLERGVREGLFSAFSLEGLRDAVATAYPDDTNLRRAVDRVEADIERGVEQVREVVSRFSRLSTMGSLVDVVLHEGNSALAAGNYLLDDLKDLVRGDERKDVAAKMEKLVLDLEIQLESIGRLFDGISPLSGRRRGRPKAVSIQTVIAQALSVLEPELLREGTTVAISGDDRKVTVDPADIIQIVVNLVRNAVFWTSQVRAAGQRHIEVATRFEHELVIRVEDNGPGVDREAAPHIFDPYYSRREGGMGMGLYIAGTIVDDFYDGSLVLVDDPDVSGAVFEATLRRRLG